MAPLSKPEPLSPPPPPTPSPPTHYFYAPISCQDEHNFIALPSYYPTDDRCRRGRRWPKIIAAACSFLLLAAVVYLFWPSDPAVRIVRMRLDRLRIHTLPVVNIDVAMHLTVKVSNADVYSMDFRRLDVAVGYRGKRLGHLTSGGGHVRALASSYVDAELEFSGVTLLSDVVFLLEDLAKGSVPFDTVTEVTGRLGLLFFGFPLKTKMSCGILINTNNQTIVHQNCNIER